MNALNQDLNPSPAKPLAASTLRQSLRGEFEDKGYRYAYAESFLNTKLASQIRTIRQQRDMTQAEVASLMGIKQSGYTRFEDVNHSVWRTDTLWNIARALDVRVNISFESFGNLIDEKEQFKKENLERPTFQDDPAFKETTPELSEMARNWVNAFSRYAAGPYVREEWQSLYPKALSAYPSQYTPLAALTDNCIPSPTLLLRTSSLQIVSERPGLTATEPIQKKGMGIAYYPSEQINQERKAGA